MSLMNPGDFNGDGRVNYVDQQIFNNYINTSNQFNANLMGFETERYPVQKAQTDPEIHSIVVIGIVIMMVCGLIGGAILGAEVGVVIGMLPGIIYMGIASSNQNKAKKREEERKAEEEKRRAEERQRILNSEEMANLRKNEGTKFYTADNIPFTYQINYDTTLSIFAQFTKQRNEIAKIGFESVMTALSMKGKSQSDFQQFPHPKFIYAIVNEQKTPPNNT